ncbi:MAG: class I SAM-dependent methyltransferase [Deltaproteobacteria bacterium]|nr:class I SAM-dependent methyltransferase [Deltaproteobacteria bacterium]
MKRTFKDVAKTIHQKDPTASFAIEFWDGDSIKIGDKPKFILKLNSLRGAKKILRDGYLGFGESYMNGDVEIENDLQELLRLGISIDFDGVQLSSWQKIRFFILALLNSDTLRTSPKNISYHYDKGNEFYELYLDNTMTYSCAYYKNGNDSLEKAQLNKFEHISRKLLLSPGESLLDIGCGWGGMLIYAAQKYGITGVGNTLSQNQCEYARNKIKELDLQDKIKILYLDYRELSGKFDKIVSIGMFEHVGKKFIPVFFKKVSSLLKREGLGLLHTIGKDAPSAIDPWTFNYIFPGAYLPILDEILREMGKNGFSILDVENLRLHYAKTLDHWAENYENNVEKVKKMFDDKFVRQWRLFLNGASAEFKYGMSRLYQILFTKGLNNTLPTTRSHVYT